MQIGTGQLGYVGRIIREECSELALDGNPYTHWQAERLRNGQAPSCSPAAVTLVHQRQVLSCAPNVMQSAPLKKNKCILPVTLALPGLMLCPQRSVLTACG